jgi:hypothetical protein
MYNSIECLYQLKKSLTIDKYNLIPDKYNFLKTMYILNDSGNYILDEDLATQDYREHMVGNMFRGTIDDEFNITYENLLNDLEYAE